MTRGIETRFACGDWVCIDGDTSIRAFVGAVTLRFDNVTYECCWFHNGSAYQSWIEEQRLSMAEG